MSNVKLPSKKSLWAAYNSSILFGKQFETKNIYFAIKNKKHREASIYICKYGLINALKNNSHCI